MVKQFRGLEVPIEPKKEWKDWMCDTSKYCALGEKGDLNCPKPGLLCHRCIYGYLSAVYRKAFYEYRFPPKPRTLPKRDSKGRFCKKEQKGGIGEYFRGLQVPVKPKKDWDWMLDRDQYCIIDKCDPEKKCSSCVYSHSNADTRALFFTETFKRGKKEKPLPKLTAEVFDRKDCPQWAQWAAVDSDGSAYFYASKPIASWQDWAGLEDGLELTRVDLTTFDAFHWWESLIERPKKFPDYSDWKLWEIRISPSTCRIIRKTLGYGTSKVRFEEKRNSAVFTVEPEDLPLDLVPAKITLLPPEELIGKVVVDRLGNYTTVIGISGDKYRISVYNIDRDKIERLSLEFFFFECHFPNGLYVASIEKA